MRTIPTPPIDTQLPDRTIVGRGESAVVYRTADDNALKLFYGHVERHTVEREFTGSSLAFRMGLRVARPIEIVRVLDRHGLSMEMLDGPVLLHRVKKSPLAMICALHALAAWQSRLHATAVDSGDLPMASQVLAHQVASSIAGAPAVAAAQNVLRSSPNGDRLCHGDLHLGNVIVTDDDLAVIDWAKAFVGCGEIDAARSELLIRYAGYGRMMRRFPPFRILRHASAEWYLLCYCLTSGRRRADIITWRLPVAVAWAQGQQTMYMPGLQRAIDAMTARRRKRVPGS
jgi:thiamine kinase